MINMNFNSKMPVAGLEPAWISPRDFESRASANSATPAFGDSQNFLRNQLLYFSIQINKSQELFK